VPVFIKVIGLSLLTLGIVLLMVFVDVRAVVATPRLCATVHAPQRVGALYVIISACASASSFALIFVASCGGHAEVFTDEICLGFLLSDALTKSTALEMARYFDACRPSARFGYNATPAAFRWSLFDLAVGNICRIVFGARLLCSSFDTLRFFAAAQVILGSTLCPCALLIGHASRPAGVRAQLSLRDT